jgi:hypothetical protein
MPVKFFHTDLDKPFLYGPHIVHRGIVILKQERASTKTVAIKLESQNGLERHCMKFDELTC